MKTIRIEGQEKVSNILIGEKLQNLSLYLPKNKIVIISDFIVSKYYKKYFSKYQVIEIGIGEKIKTLETVAAIYEKLMAYEVDRSTFICGIGGGIVCDIAGFVASTYMRGLSFGFVSTTLLSQVDASVGGKNGVNFHGFKNMIGTFSQPEFVICDSAMLSTLNEKVFISGFAEVIKAAIIKDFQLFEFLEQNFSKALKNDETVMNKIIYNSLIVKSEIVRLDEKEKGERIKLNLGHTLAHAIEKKTGMLHGEAVSIGIVVAIKISQILGTLSAQEGKRIIKLLNNFKLPVDIKIIDAEIIEFVRNDKKRVAENINFVILSKIGNAEIKKLSMKKLEELLN